MEEKFELNVAALRVSASEGRGICALLEQIRVAIAPDELTPFLACNYMWQSFGPSRVFIEMCGAVRLGNAAYSDEELEALVNPVIQDAVKRPDLGWRP